MEAACGGAAGCVAAARTCCSRARGCARTFRWCGPNPSSVLPALTTDARLALPQVLPQGAADLCAPPHASRPCGAAARRPPLVTRAAQEMDCRYVSTPLCLYAAMSLRRYVATPLCLFAATSLRREMRTRVCDGRALRMRVMAVQRCTGVGTCVARPRPQSPFANGWASGS